MFQCMPSKDSALATEADLARMLYAAIGHAELAVLIYDASLSPRFMNLAAQALLRVGVAQGPGDLDARSLWETMRIDPDAALAAIDRGCVWHGSRTLEPKAGAAAQCVDIAISPFRGEISAGLMVVAHLVPPQSSRRRRASDAEVVAASPRLTPRQKDVMLGLLEGRSNKVIGLGLGISPRTVEFHRAQLMHRFGAKSLVELIRKVVHDARAVHRDDAQ